MFWFSENDFDFVILEFYIVREVRIYVRYIRDLLKFVDFVDVYNGVDCNFFFFLNIVIVGDILG